MAHGVRLRITVAATVAVAVVLLVIAAVLVTIERRVLVEQLDEALVAEVGRVRTTMGARADWSEPLLLTPVVDDDGVIQAVDAESGRVVATTPNVAGLPPIGPPDGSAPHTVGGLPGTSGQQRFVTDRVTSDDGRALVVHVAAPVDDIDEAVRSLVVALAILGPAVCLLLAAVVYVLVGRTLRPVERIRSEVASIGPDHLDRRVPVPAGDDEITRLAATMNDMLARLETSDHRQRRFVADASHELRTPLTRMRSELEVDLRHPDTADPAATARSVRREIDHLQQLIDDLLLLARSDGDPPIGALRPVDLDDIVLEETLAAAQPGITLDVHEVSGAQVLGDPEQLRRVVRNVLDNAVRHARAVVTVSLAEHPGGAVLTITDDGPGIPADRADDVFERFTSLDDARASGHAGAGLGLAIARDIVRHHAGTITVDGSHHGGARLVVVLPTSMARVDHAAGDAGPRDR